jgi:hypothetical protein
MIGAWQQHFEKREISIHYSQEIGNHEFIHPGILRHGLFQSSAMCPSHAI